ncbi:hypothetical protein [Streptosporangium sp. NPDC002607]
MAWEWVAPVATAVSGVIGVGFTWYAGHQGRQHAEQVAKQNTSSTLAQAREARRASAYLDILTTVNGMTGSVNHITAVYKDQEDPPLRELDEQVATSAKVALYGSQAVREIHEEWFGHVRTLLNNHREIQAGRDSGAGYEPGVWRQQEVERKAMNAAVKQLQDQMNSELAS